MNAVHMHGLTVHRINIGPLETLTDLCRDTDGPQVVGRNQADDVVDVYGPRPFERRTGCLRRQPMPPPLTVQYPAEINSRPTWWVI